MGKRKRSGDKDYQHILRKVRKLESKLRKRRYSSSSTSSDDGQMDEYRRYYDANIPGDDVIDVEGEEDHQSINFSPELNYIEIEGTEPSQPPVSVAPPGPAAPPESAVLRPRPATPASPRALDPPAAPLLAPVAPSAPPHAPIAAAAPTDAPAPGPSGIKTYDALPLVDDSVPPLEPEILLLLGDDPDTEKKYGENLHKDIASRWAHVLCNGLSKETQLDLVKQYLPSKNCPNMAAPKLNLEIKAALSEINVKKDLYSQTKQTQLSNCLAALGQVLNWALSPNSNVPQNIIKTLSDAGRLICDNHYKESLSRRYSALNALNRNIRDTVKDTKIDEHLFGAALGDHIKSSKAINKTVSEIKPAPLRPAYRIPPIAPPQRGALNCRGAPPRTVAATEPRSTPAPRRPPPRDRTQEAARGRRPANPRRYYHTKKR